MRIHVILLNVILLYCYIVTNAGVMGWVCDVYFARM